MVVLELYLLGSLALPADEMHEAVVVLLKRIIDGPLIGEPDSVSRRRENEDRGGGVGPQSLHDSPVALIRLPPMPDVAERPRRSIAGPPEAVLLGTHCCGLRCRIS